MPPVPLTGRRAALLLALALAACDADPLMDGADLAEDAFTIRVDGAEPETLRGALFGTYETERGTTFALLLGADPGTQARALSRPATGFLRDGGAPATGPHVLGATTPGAPQVGTVTGFYIDPGEFVPGEAPARSGLYYTGSGTLTVDSLVDGRMRGSFEMRAVEFDEDLAPEGDVVSVRGTFHAVASDAFGEAGGLLGRRGR